MESAATRRLNCWWCGGEDSVVKIFPPLPFRGEDMEAWQLAAQPKLERGLPFSPLQASLAPDGASCAILSPEGEREDSYIPGSTPVRSTERSEERRVGKECDSTCKSRWSAYH